MIFGSNIPLFGRSIIILLLIISYLSMVGCASTPELLSPESRIQLGHVGIVALPSNPRVEFHTYAKGWAAGAAKGGAYGAIEGLLQALVELSRNPPTGSFAGLIIMTALAVSTTVGMTVYGVGGAIEAVPHKTAQEIEQNLNAAMKDVNLTNDLAEKIYAISVRQPELEHYAVTRLWMPFSEIKTNHVGLSQQGINTILEVQVTELGFRGGRGSQPRVSFYMNAFIRLLATDTGREIYKRDFQYLSYELQFEEWFINGSKELLEVFKKSMMTLARRISDELFMVTYFPFDSGLWALPGQPEFGSCWFRPIYPEVKYTSLLDSIRDNTIGSKIRYTEVDSLRPQLRWEAFPRPRDQKPDNASMLTKITDVTYDLKIWDATGDYPEKLVYDISGLHDPQYRPKFPLKPKTKYFWTFRVRYKLSGQAQVTRWAFSNIPSNVPSEYPRRQAGGTCDLDFIPSSNYYRFTTP